MSDMKRNTYIENHDDQQALQDYLQALGELQGEAEELSVLDAVGRITYQAVFAVFVTRYIMQLLWTALR